MKNRPLIRPQISINGTSKRELLAQQLDVMSSARALLHSMSNAMPHGRDYQHRPNEYLPARAAWLDRMNEVRILIEDIEKHAENFAL